jgi:hypothetical protein
MGLTTLTIAHRSLHSHLSPLGVANRLSFDWTHQELLALAAIPSDSTDRKTPHLRGLSLAGR